MWVVPQPTKTQHYVAKKKPEKTIKKYFLLKKDNYFR